MTGVDEAIAAVEAEVLESLNTTYEDATAFLARVHGDRRQASAARAVGVSAAGLELLAIDDEGEHPVVVAFGAPVELVDELWLSIFATVAATRERSGEEGTTSIERIIAQAAGYRTFFAEVRAVADIGPGLREVTVGGGDLAEGFAPVGPDTYLYLLLPPPGRRELTVDAATFSWEAVKAMAPSEQPVGAYYTVRRWRPEVAELDLWVVTHGGSGPASSWALQAQAGDPLALWGPRTAWAPPAGTDEYLLVVDETGLPAAAVVLEELPSDAAVVVLAEVADADHRQPLPERPGVQVRWLHRDGAAPGTTTLLADAVAELHVPSGHPYVWGGAESRAMRDVRRHVRDAWGLHREQVSLLGYWRRSADDADDADEDDDA